MGVALVVVVAIVIVLARYSRTARSQQALPPGLDLKSGTLDLGRLSSTSTVTGSFELSNRGAATYQIEKIVPECGCTVVRASDPVLRPNAAIQIPVTANAYGWGDGLKFKRVAVSLKDNTGGSWSILLTVKATIQPANHLAVVPGRIDIRNARRGEALALPLYVRGDKSVVDSLPGEIRVQAGSPNCLTVEPPKPRGWFECREIVLIAPAPNMASKPTSETFEIVIAGSYHERIQIPIRIAVQE
ncbi:MAG TPA: DUF1573 domain-containing protein [Tepidisphaeraceae bacterium]|nr:DUF1573 domain-containing protein [Tepidisphaeraceae bacterium]